MDNNLLTTKENKLSKTLHQKPRASLKTQKPTKEHVVSILFGPGKEGGRSAKKTFIKFI